MSDAELRRYLSFASYPYDSIYLLVVAVIVQNVSVWWSEYERFRCRFQYSEGSDVAGQKSERPSLMVRIMKGPFFSGFNNVHNFKVIFYFLASIHPLRTIWLEPTSAPPTEVT
jgi:hypothetical protein